eukprot:12400971-Alexandrium_andersonii.AAC.1
MGKDRADCGLADCGLEPASWRFRDFGPPRSMFSWVGLESAREVAQNPPSGASGTNFEAIPGPAQLQ